MRSEGRENAYGRRILALVFVLLLAVVGANECPSRDVRNVRDALLAWITDSTELNLDSIPSDLRIHRYPEILRENDFVEPFPFDGVVDTSKRLTCESNRGCLLFFVDFDHWAHFAHTTAIALLELDSGQLKGPVIDEWWPLLNGEPIYDTVGKREVWRDSTDPDPSTIIVHPQDFVPQLRRADPVGIWVEERSPTRVATAVPTQAPDGGDTEDCRVWAVIVDGYKVDDSRDEDDTFHVDTDGIYRAVRGHGVPDQNIFFLCPDPDKAEGCNLEASPGELEAVLTGDLGEDLSELDSEDPACLELLLFYASHGGKLSLRCGEETLPHSNLIGWLGEVQCEKITVVVEACKSGALINLLVGENEENVPDGQTRLVFTSTESDDQKSYRDKDSTLDKNPGDIGSETVWGYVEAFGMGLADDSNDAEISFSEATDYAIDNDVSIDEFHHPGKSPTGDTVGEAHSCTLPPPNPKLKIEIHQEEVPTAPAGLGQLLRCRCNGFLATISHPGGAPPPVATARFYWTAVSDAKWLKNCAPDDTGSIICETDVNQVWDSTRMIGSHQDFPVTIDVFWNVGSDIEAGTEITLLAIADSPHVKIPQDADISLSDLVENYDQADALTLEVVNPSSCFIFPCGCRTLRCD